MTAAFASASIPPPPWSDLEVGPVSIHMYGVMLLLGIIAAIALTVVRWRRRGGEADLVFRMSVWGVAFGVIGARAYHVATSWDTATEEWWTPFAVWEGGLGIWGAIPAGVAAGAVVVRLSGNSVRAMADAAAPGLLLAQGIGRWGNWWNQELFGKPSERPWALEVEPEHHEATDFEGVDPFQALEYEAADTFHPTFLYESLWNLLGVAVLLVVDRLFRIRPPALFALYVAVYTAGRFFIERLRIDPAPEVAGMRWNAWVSLVLFALAVIFFVYWQFFRSDPTAPRVEPRGKPGPAMAIPKKRVRH